MTASQHEAAIARCDREQEEILARTGDEAWLIMLGFEDWEMERRMIETEFSLLRKAAAA